ncbi:class F sortase [Streptomyces sp. NPDC001070]
MLRNPGEHTTPVPWYGHPDAWYGQPDPWFGQPFVPGHTADAARAAGRPGRTPQPPARARPVHPATPQAGAAPKAKPKRKGKPAQQGQAVAKSPATAQAKTPATPAAKAAPKSPATAQAKTSATPAAKAAPKSPATAEAKTSATPAAKAAPKAPARPAAKGARPAAGTAQAQVRAGGAAAQAGRPPVRRPAGPGTGGAVRRAAGRPGQLRLTRRGRGAVGVVVCSVLVTGVVLTFDGFAGKDGPPQPSAASAALPDGAGTIKVPPPLPPAQPTRIRIRSVSIDAPIMNVGLDSRGIIAAPPPEKASEAAWFKDSVSPGARGSSVIVGHVDNESGPAVFYSLGALKKGSTIDVARDDGTTATFTIYGIEVFTKAEFPAKRVYGDTKDPELRVITCGGTYSKASGYSGNVVVFARLSKTKAAKV